MKPVKMVDSERMKPLSYDPVGKRFLYLSDILKGERYPPGRLDDDLKRELVLKRYELEGESSIESLEKIDKQQQMDHIRTGTDVGQRLVDQEITFLGELIEKIAAGVVC